LAISSERYASINAIHVRRRTKQLEDCGYESEWFHDIPVRVGPPPVSVSCSF
jgi:hypothetical protein